MIDLFTPVPACKEAVGAHLPPVAGTWRATRRTLALSGCLPGLCTWKMQTPDVLSTSLISSRSVSAGALLWAVGICVCFCSRLDKLGITQKRREAHRKAGAAGLLCPGLREGSPLLMPTSPLLIPVTPPRCPGRAQHWLMETSGWRGEIPPLSAPLTPDPATFLPPDP